MRRPATRTLFLFFAVLAAGIPSLAGEPGGVLSGTANALTWSGGPYTAVATDASSCTAQNCDTFYLTVNAHSGFFSSHPNHEVQIRITWPEPANKFDLYLFDSSGKLLASSVQASESFEEINAGPLSNGSYKLVIVASQTLNASYSGTARIVEDPPSANGRARYIPGEMMFGAPFKLPRPNNPANSNLTLVPDQNVEPRVVHDPLGNLYVASIRGVPGGVDVWKSYDTGKTFTYLGAPDGFGNTGATTGNGVGGGEEDLAVGSSGNVYVNSLWLGSSVQASTFSGGNSWAVSPLSADIAADGRPWIAADSNNIVYLTFKQSGHGTNNIVVLKSGDGGLTFPQVTQVTTPESGVQPGGQGNLVVDPANGDLYNVFFDRAGSQVYLARSIDGGATFDLKLIHQGPAGVSLAHVFPSIAVDGGGHLHVVFSDGATTFLTTSQDSGMTWSHAVRVNNGAATRTAIQPWVVAGDSGQVDITWLGSAAANSMDSSAQWQVFLAQSQNDFASVPTFAQATVTGIIHAGPVCVSDSGCPAGSRTLAEYWAPDVYLDGNALIVYSDDKNSGLSSGSARTWFVRQSSGPTIIETVQ
ncbi:MAG TPA: sialidase family protein [Candidatus Angelobacter sp.]|nr:sialidase family protein [Candidatus Angelobacter sp.]